MAIGDRGIVHSNLNMKNIYLHFENIILYDQTKEKQNELIKLYDLKKNHDMFKINISGFECAQTTVKDLAI